MRFAKVSTLVAFSVLLAAAQAQASAPAAPSQDALRTMSDADFRAFLAKPATRTAHVAVKADKATPCPVVDNEGIASFFYRMFGGR